MKYYINPTVWSSAFAVPAQLVDKHIKNVNGQQLKVFLWLCRHNADEYDFQELVKGVGMSDSDVKDSMQYWVAQGLVSCDDSKIEVVKDKTQDVKKVEEKTKPKQEPIEKDKKKKLLDLPDIAPNHQQVAKRLLECPELQYLYNEAQTILGRTIGFDTQAKLLMIHDHYGLPVEVILMIISYAVTKGKSSMTYITKVSKDWGEREINTFEKANEKINDLSKSENNWKKFTSMISIDPPKYTDKRSEYINKWHNQMEFTFDMIYLAYEETINNTNKANFAYTDKILYNWKEKNVKNKSDLVAVNNERIKKFSNDKSAKKGESWNNKEASYDINKIKEKARGPLVYKRREG